MHKLETKDSYIMRVALQQEVFRSEESRYVHRLHGVLLVCSRPSYGEVADLFGQGRRSIQYWAKRFEKSGFAGLQEGARPGRPSDLDAQRRKEISQDLRRSPRTFGYSQYFWDGMLLSHHLNHKYELHLGVRQCQRLFSQLGFRRRKPRPKIASANPIAQ